jgi:hypothetical protein
MGRQGFGIEITRLISNGSHCSLPIGLLGLQAGAFIFCKAVPELVPLAEPS